MTTESVTEFLNEYTALRALVGQINEFLETRHPHFFGANPAHPFLKVKRTKVIHDNLWGTVGFSWRELALIDSPIMQRLRDIHQTGLAYHVYPSARHTRFEHCLGATTISARVFDALLYRQRDVIRDVVRVVVGKEEDSDKAILRLKQELRLAALLHDTGHSLFSHTSERVYEQLDILQRASKELSSFVGKEKGAGEVISFCTALTPAVRHLLDRAETKLIGDIAADDYQGPIDLINVALLIVGRSKHPFLQFLGDIISSGFDADKLDYLLRDASMAGLPLKYDLDRYLYDIRLEKEMLPDDKEGLQKLYSRTKANAIQRKSGNVQIRFPYYETYRLRLSHKAMNVIEQIVICKMMLFSYIYHHPKVRASEGLLQRLLNRSLDRWRKDGESDSIILNRFLEMTDSSLRQWKSDDKIVQEYSYRLLNRLTPREVYSISGPSATHAEGLLIQEFLIDLHDRKRRDEILQELERTIGTELIALDQNLGPDPIEAIARAGVWVDVPKPPKFEDVDDMVKGGGPPGSGVPIAQIFPIREWTQAYEHYRYQVRIFAFSEYCELAAAAAKKAMERVLEISSASFYDGIRRDR